MKKLLTLTLCLCAFFALGFSLNATNVKHEPEEVASLAKKDVTGVREGSEDEGICLLQAFAGK